MRKTNLKKYILIFIIFSFGSFFVSCAKNTNGSGDKASVENNKVEKKEETKLEKGPNDKNPIVTIDMENGDKIKIELYPEVAPNTVRNFVSLVQKGFYDGVIFHRVIPGFMIQAGDPKGIGTGGPGYSIKGEFTSNKFKNDLKHEKGVISMARGEGNNSAGSQFFIMVKEAPHLDGKYAAFGKVIDGMEIADKIVAVERNPQDKPLKEQKMNKVTVDTFGVKYNEVEKMK